MVPEQYLDDAFICTKYYISPKNVSLKKILKCRLINDITYKFSSIIVLQIISIVEKQQNYLLVEKPYRNDNINYLTIECADQNKRFVAPTY